MKAVNVLNLPVNRRVDDGNVAVDFCAVSEGFDVGGVDRQGVSQVTCSESVTHWKEFTNISSKYYSHVGAEISDQH